MIEMTSSPLLKEPFAKEEKLCATQLPLGLQSSSLEGATEV